MLAPDLGASRHCRREVFDALAAAPGRSLPYPELRNQVEPRLRKFVLREIQNAGGIDAYMLGRLQNFKEPDGVQDRMLVHSGTDADLLAGGDVAMDQEFRLRVIGSSGRVVYYEPGMQPALDRLAVIKSAVLHLRASGEWDCLPPMSKSGSLQESLERHGWITGVPPVMDATGFVIDGRKRQQLADDLRVKIPASHKWANRGVPVVQGIIESFDLNRDRLEPGELKKYHAKIEKKLGISWDELVELSERTNDEARNSNSSAIVSRNVEIPGIGMIIISDDWSIVQIRSTLKALGLEAYWAQKVEDAFGREGMHISHRKSSGSQEAKWFQLDDLLPFVDRSPQIWPRNPERSKRYLEGLAQIAQELGDLREQAAAG